MWSKNSRRAAMAQNADPTPPAPTNRDSHAHDGIRGSQSTMPILHIEHEISDLTTWLEAFKRFAPAREQAGVQQTQVFQPSDDSNYIVVNLHFESIDAASNFRTFLQNVIWQSPEASPALVGAPSARVLTEVSV